MDVLLFLKDDQLSLDLEVILLKIFQCNIIKKNTIADAIAEINQNKNLKLILANDVLNNERVFSTLLKEVQDSNLEIPIVCRQTAGNNVNIRFKIDEKNLEKNIEIFTSILREYLIEFDKLGSMYVPVRIEQFLAVEKSNLSCDIYIKINKFNQPNQFVKRLHAKDHFSKEEIVHYMNAGLREFYIDKDQYHEFINMISVEVLNALKNVQDNKENKYIDNFTLNVIAYETCIERVKLFGAIDDLTIQFAEGFIKSIVKTIESNSSLSDYFKHLKSGNAPFSYYQNYLISVLSERISKLFNWNSPQSRSKFVYLAFFHNISIPEESLGKISNEEELILSSISKKDKDRVLNHANASAEMINNFNDVPFGLVQLIREHHGVKSGHGFNEFLSTSISPMSMMFIVLEEFSRLFILNKIETQSDLEKLLIFMFEKYNKSTYFETMNYLKMAFRIED